MLRSRASVVQRARSCCTNWPKTSALIGSGSIASTDETGALRAADAVTGETLWSFPTNQGWRASPMTYAFDGRQFIGVASGNNVIAFALPRDAAIISNSK